MMKELDLDLDLDRLISEYNSLDIETMLNGNKKQISVQKRGHITGDLQYTEGTHSLYYDWEGYDPAIHDKPKMRKKFLKEKEFDTVCDKFNNTYIGELTQHLYETYSATRGRFMMLEWKTCLTYHKDNTPRLHVPIVTNEDCFMIVDDKVVRLPIGGAYIVDTRLKHTALNASKENRTHLVFCLPVDHSIDS